MEKLLLIVGIILFGTWLFIKISKKFGNSSTVFSGNHKYSLETNKPGMEAKGNIVNFNDGSWCNLETGESENKGEGYINLTLKKGNNTTICQNSVGSSGNHQSITIE